MIKKLKRITLQMMAGANIATIVIMLLIGYSGLLNPVNHPTFANINLLFPIFLLLNLAFLIFWIIFKLKDVMIPVIGFIICYQPIRLYFPLNTTHDVPDRAIKVLSYNVWMFAGWADSTAKNPIIEYIKDQDADIVCLQEAEVSGITQEKIDNALDYIYKYKDATEAESGGDLIVTYSKFPILKREPIPYESNSNHSSACFVQIGNDTVLVVNNHFQSIGLSPDEKMRFKYMVKGKLKSSSAENESKLLIDKLGIASRLRASQAQAVALYLREHSDKSIILCGDFNDSPLSYVHRTVSEDLTDCYTETGNGLGISYHHNGFYVRIDNIMCSKDWQPYKCKVDTKIDTSDHYPIICWLKKRDNP